MVVVDLVAAGLWPHLLGKYDSQHPLGHLLYVLLHPLGALLAGGGQVDFKQPRLHLLVYDHVEAIEFEAAAVLYHILMHRLQSLYVYVYDLPIEFAPGIGITQQ